MVSALRGCDGLMGRGLRDRFNVRRSQEVHPYFPKRTNVQFMKVLNYRNIQIEIWEIGAGYTLASGSSSSAAAVTHRLSFCDWAIANH